MRVIPGTFKLGPHDFNIEIHLEGILKDGEGNGAEGLMIIGTQLIQLEEVTEDKNKAAQIQCFFHELTHAILAVMGHPLCHDEEFVEAFSQLLYQAIKTKRGHAKEIV